ncbi:MAG TPA: Gfo/Idh/MocA family oxidoreductase [Planctomycetaceae bacterium]|jgi:predicted dehydrogenase
MPVDQSLSRRHFLVASGVAATAVAFSAKSYGRVIGANDRIRMGFIGAGGMGSGHIGACLALKDKDNLEFLGVADCWKTRADEGAAKLGTSAFTDYRKVLETDIDYVTIATPEHWHSQMTIDALDAGKAVYVEKPMTHTIPQAQAVVKKVKETKLPLQVGVQAMSDDSYASAGEAIKRGVIGKVVQAQIEYVRRYDKQGPWRDPGITDATAQPADLDWNAWLGQAPKIGWNPHHYYEWRNYSTYSGGICTDLFIHRITRIMKACDLLYPRRVVGMGGIWQWPDGRDLPDNFEMICEYPRGMTVYVLGTMSNRVGIDHLIRGYRGTLYFTGSGWVAKDKDGKVLDQHEKTGGEDIHLHHTNLHKHLREGTPLNCPIELGMAGVVAVNMANESWRSNTMMGWDAKAEKMVPAHTLTLGHEPEEA